MTFRFREFLVASPCDEACGRNNASLMHLNVRSKAESLSVEIQKSEIVMSELSERAASGSFPTAANPEAEAAKLNQGALEFMLGAQKMMLEELVFLGDEMLERTRTEMHLPTEFVPKMAGAHSVKDLQTTGDHDHVKPDQRPFAELIGFQSRMCARARNGRASFASSDSSSWPMRMGISSPLIPAGFDLSQL
ncbi:hypothetical protein [Bradyrhizobium australiense]|uniref:Uncharacterized protein n=1 Tax=Bradyrhizobium australiense TaxID=2721161 RepID=A0A7Y4GWJ0_9BRAD|nr:hypothetical protein [Bradyrhizobium australiense]NOJ43054.1 hypothetical protein [Bradyrhizobium australiense]